ncbi:restriction endonuclease [Streptomyces sp. NPDC058451]|uniref:restriction endonuclease n=1 Tax=Streptomyces sp. NPDC058451 TaxID=3346506 RepID=UPI003665E52F
MRRSRLKLRAPRGRGEQLAAVVVMAAAGWMLLRTAAVLGHAAACAWPLTAALAAAALGYGVWRIVRAAAARRAKTVMLARLRITLEECDAMDDRQFEYALRDLLIRDGFHARQVGRAGDQGADVIAEHRRLGRLVVQAKHTKVAARVGSHVMYQVNGTAGPVHHADIAVVVTNGHITRDAKTWGQRHHIHWVDRDRLGQWAQDGIPLHQLLRLPARRGRRKGAGLARGAAS